MEKEANSETSNSGVIMIRIKIYFNLDYFYSLTYYSVIVYFFHGQREKRERLVEVGGSGGFNISK